MDQSRSNCSPAPFFSTPGLSAAAVFTGMYMSVSAVVAVRESNFEFIFYVGVVLVLISLLTLVHWKFRFSTGLIWCLCLWGFLHMAGGLVAVPESWPINGPNRVLYSWWIIPAGEGASIEGWLKYDNVIHAFGFGTTAWLCWQGLRNGIRLKYNMTIVPTIAMMTICITASLGFGALNEIVEFIAAMTMESNVGGYVNTGLDLVFNTVGAVIAATLIYFRSA